MLVIPAIDILDGRVVRVEQGDENRSKVYSESPFETAKILSERGATLLHVVDLNAAIHGDLQTNREIVEEMLRKLSSRLAFEVAGGIKSESAVSSLLEMGATRIVLGSLAYSNEETALSILKKNGANKIVLALDYDSEGKVKTRGWKKAETENVESAVVRFSNLGFETFLLTSIKRDGMLKGPDIETLSSIRKVSTKNRIRLIASGGVSSDKDLLELSKIGMDEAVVGKAIYEGKISSFAMELAK